MQRHILYTLCALLMFTSHAGHADSVRNGVGTPFVKHESVTGVFEAKFPEKYNYNIFPFYYAKDKLAISGEVIATMRDRNNLSPLKDLAINVYQTFGQNITHTQALKILDDEDFHYDAFAKNLGGKLIKKETIKHKDYLGKDYYILYDDEDDGTRMGMRIRVYMTDTSKVEQIINGPADNVYSYRSNDYFTSLSLFDGRQDVKKDLALGTGWITHNANNGLFSIKAPPQNKFYAPIPVQQGQKGNMERIKYRLTDPVLKQTAFFEVTSHTMPQPITLETAKQTMFSEAVSRYAKNANMNTLQMNIDTQDDITTITSKIVIIPPKNYPYLNTLNVELRYSGHHIIVKEFLSTHNHSITGLKDTLFDMVTFTPQSYKAPQQGSQGQ